MLAASEGRDLSCTRDSVRKSVAHIRSLHRFHLDPAFRLEPFREASSGLALAFNHILTLTESLCIHYYIQILVLLISSGGGKHLIK